MKRSPTVANYHLGQCKAVDGTLLRDLELYFKNPQALRKKLTEVADVLEYDIDDLQVELERDPFKKIDIKKRSASRPKANKRRYLMWKYTLTGFGIPYQAFSNVLEQSAPETNEEVIQQDFETFSVEEESERIYESIMDGPLSCLKSRLWVFDYLDRQSFKHIDFRKNYSKDHDEYFKKILNSILKYSEKLSYVRILSLPIDYNYEKKSEDQILKSGVDYCSFESFKHLCDYIHYSNNISGDNSDSLSGFYLMTRPSFFKHFAIINDGDFVYEEDFYLNKIGDLKSSRINLDKKGDQTKKLFKEYETRILKLLKEPSILSVNNLSVIYKVTKELYNELQGEVNSNSLLNRKDIRINRAHLAITKKKLDYIKTFMPF